MATGKDSEPLSLQWLSRHLLARFDETESAYSDGYNSWLSNYFPHVANKSLAPHHHELWKWFENLRPGVRPKPRVVAWPRGGAKSSTAELAIAYLAKKLTRRFVLYVCNTQDQADMHVQSVARLIEAQGIERALGRYGHSTGWRRDELQTATGYAVSAFGLDGAIRGIKVQNYRPDLIIFDDFDAHNDTPQKIQKKIVSITSSILPAGSSDCATLFLQNVIHEDGIMAQLIDGRAKFLYDREAPAPVVAVNNLQVEAVRLDEGRNGYKIVGGEPTWEGQDLSVCEAQINEWGYDAFLREAQHNVENQVGYFFNHKRFNIVSEYPELIFVVRSWDLAATEGDGDYTVGVLMGVGKNGQRYVLDVKRGQWSSERVRAMVEQTTISDMETFKRVYVTIPQDPGQAGKAQKHQFQLFFRSLGVSDDRCQLISKPVTGSKAVRARGWANEVNSGNANLVGGEWNYAFMQEHRRFREDEEHLYDDQVDASSDANNFLAVRTKMELKFY